MGTFMRKSLGMVDTGQITRSCFSLTEVFSLIGLDENFHGL